jgi:deoxyribodipyrimidine photo-lyase
MNPRIAIAWMRRDLRLEDNAALYHALKGPLPVLPLFIFDPDILEKLPSKTDARVQFIHDTLAGLKSELEAMGSSLLVEHGQVEDVWKSLLTRYEIGAVYFNEDYEPNAMARDSRVGAMLAEKGIAFHGYKDHVIFAKDEVLKDDGTPYTVFTPYSKRWLRKLESKLALDGSGGSFYLQSYPTKDYWKNFLQITPLPFPTLGEIGFHPSPIEIPSAIVARDLIRRYAEQRDYPAIQGTSRLGLHFRFGTVSIREKARNAQVLNATFLNELIWRDFYSMILQHFPHVATGAFRPQYEKVLWRNDEDEFAAWCQGKTGFPIVDAGMRELNATGFMHNRVRMITASFLTKHMLVDWRLGEAYFAEKLLDFDLASNNGGWQWAAGCGTDAAPYFRVFNPHSQQEKFDPQFTYIRKWVPEYGTPAYCKPILDLGMARDRCLATYKAALKGLDS